MVRDVGKKLPFEGFNFSLLPDPLCGVISNLLKEQAENGVSTTADETCEAIEAWFKLVGGLLLAEYLDAGAPDHDLNRYAFASLESKRGLFVGQWVAQSRGCLNALNRVWGEGYEPTWPSLRNLNFGNPNDSTHPITRLISYRNKFSHGSFSQVENEIVEHGLLLEEQVKLLADDLSKRPICFTLPDATVGVLVGDEARKDPDQKSPVDLPPYTPYVPLPNGKQRILAPALAVKPSEDCFLLLPSNMGALPDPTFLTRFEQALERFHREQQGYVRFGKDDIPQQGDSAAHGVEGFDSVIAEQNVLTLVEFRPGTGQKLLAGRLLGGIEKMLSKSAVWRVLDNHPGGSGIVFGRFLMRSAESVLSLPEGHMEEKDMSLAQSISTAGRLLAEPQKSVGVVIMDAERGAEKGPNEPLSVVDVCKTVSTSNSGFRLVLLSKPTFGGRLPHDGAVLAAPIPGAGKMDIRELETELRDWLDANGKVGELTLRWLCERPADSPLLLSDIVEEINRADKAYSLFPPAVEHALLTAAPFIDRRIDEGQISLQPAGGYDGDYHNSLKEFLSGG